MTARVEKFKVNDRVRVRDGVKDPDFNWELGGWTGRITECDKTGDTWLYKIRWDRSTLDNAGSSYVDQCEEANLNYEVIYLEEEQLELMDDYRGADDGFFVA